MKKTKQILALLAVVALALSLAACGKQPAPADSASAAQSAASAALDSAAQAAPDGALPQDTTDGANAMQAITPPYEEAMRSDEIPEFLPPDLQQLSNAASFWAKNLLLGTGFALDYTTEPVTMENGMQYYPAADFSSYTAFRAAMDATFTKELTDQLLNDSMLYIDNGEDKLYAADAGRGGNMFYKGATFVLKSASDAEIVITMTAHYAEDIDENGNHSEAEETQDYTLRLVKTDAGWRFASYALPM